MDATIYKQLIWAISAHIVWVFVLYTYLTLARAPKVWGLSLPGDLSLALQNQEPRISANLSNQFEWPLIFYSVCILQISSPLAQSKWIVYCAWFFVIGRVLHSLVHIFTSNIRLRGIVFTINFVAVLLMLFLYLYPELGF